MANNGSFCVIEKQDSEGSKLRVGKYVRNNGEVVEFPAVFKNTGCIIDSWDEFVSRDDDVWLVSYSRAGTHWTYEILQMLLKGEATPAQNYKESSMIENAQSVEEINSFPSPRVLNTHLRPQYLPEQALLKGKIIHVARNPKSIMVSNFFQISGLAGISYEGSLHSYLTLFMNGHYNTYGSWFEYMFDWWKFAQEQTNVHMLFYEDLIQNDQKEIKKIADFLGVRHDDEFINQVSSAASFDKMKAGVGKATETLQQMADMWKDKSNKMMRKGKKSDWKNHMTVADNEYFDNFYEDKMKECPALKSMIRFE